MPPATYDPAGVIFTVNGLIASGFAEGTFIEIERNEDMWGLQIGAQGEGARIKSNDKSGQLRLTLMQTSDFNQVLSGLAQLDEQSNGGAVTVAVEIIGTNTVYIAETAWIKKLPMSDFSKTEGGTRQWIFETDVLTMNLSGSN